MSTAVAEPPARQLARIVDRTDLRALSHPSNGPGLALLAAHGAALAAGAVWVWAARGTWWVVPAVVVYGAVMAHLFALLHEASHRTPFASRRLSTIIAHATGFVLFLPAGYFRFEHLAHHQATQDPERDPELIAVPRSLPAYVAFVAGGPYWWWAIRTTGAHVAGRILAFECSFLPPNAHRRVITEARLYAAGYGTIAVLAVATGTVDVLLWLWLVPRLVGEPWMRIARLSEHAGLPLTPDITENTRSLSAVPLPLRLLAWNMPYHAEHHAAPGVPFHALPRLHARLGEHLQSAPGGYLAAQRDIVGRIRKAEQTTSV